MNCVKLSFSKSKKMMSSGASGASGNTMVPIMSPSTTFKSGQISN